MYNFSLSLPTVVHFGKGQIEHLKELKESGDKVLMVYGGGSIKKNGIYEKAMSLLKGEGMEVFELSGVEPNPRIQTVRKGAALCKEKGINMLLAIGGGSTIDCAKVIAAAAVYDKDAWDLVVDYTKIKSALPIYTVLTLAATGSEMDSVAVISDMEINEKRATFSDKIAPKMSILDPEYTYSVSRKQTASGTADMMSHVMENYFSKEKGTQTQKYMAEGLLRTMIKYGPIALETPDDYDARANLMLAATHAINGIVGEGVSPGWGIHAMEHELSAFYDVTHGEGLAILTPAWMEYILNEKTVSYFADFARNVWGLQNEDEMQLARDGIAALRSFFFETMKLPANLRAVGIIDQEKFEIMAEKAAKGCRTAFVPLKKADVLEILKSAF